MPPCTSFYQIGGLQAHSWAWDRFKPWNEGEDALARAIAGPNSPLLFGDTSAGVELILGIFKSGASCLLLSLDQMRVFTAHFRLREPSRPPHEPKDFISLSPIAFKDVGELTKKFKSYAQKPSKGKGKGKKVMEVGDTSQANRGYMRVHEGEGVPPGIARGAFEHNRILYSLLRHSVDPHKFGLPYFPWASVSSSPDTGIRFVSLALNTWAKDERKRNDRLKEPIVLDVGWSEREGMGGQVKYVHIKVEENAMHRQGYPEAPFAHGETQVLPRSAFATALRDLFLSFSTSPSSPGEAEPGPVVLLLHDADTTHAMLQCAGVDLGACVPGIRDLLVRGPLAPPAPPNPNPDLYLDYGNQEDGRDTKRWRDRDRARSRSPTPKREPSHIPITSSTASYRARRPSPICPARPGNPNPNPSSPARNVYIIDLQELYRRLMQTDGTGGRGGEVRDTARALGLGVGEGWCAGNECCTLFDIWGAMASGSPIDEQRAYWLTTSAAGLAAVAVLDDTPVPDYYGGGEDGEDDRDPNDVAAMQAQAMAAQEAVGARGGTDPYANLEDDDDDDW